MKGEDFIRECILERQSCRAFLNEKIPEEHVQLLLEAMRWAPSAGNLQPWRFYVVSNAEVRRKLAQSAYEQNFIAEAPVVFVICAIPRESEWRYGKRGRELYSIQDTACAGMNLMISAKCLGYGSVWVGAFDEGKVSDVLALKEYERPVAIIPVGKPKHLEVRSSRKPYDAIARFI